MFLAKFI